MCKDLHICSVHGKYYNVAMYDFIAHDQAISTSHHKFYLLRKIHNCLRRKEWKKKIALCMQLIYMYYLCASLIFVYKVLQLISNYNVYSWQCTYQDSQHHIHALSLESMHFHYHKITLIKKKAQQGLSWFYFEWNKAY